MNKTIMHINYIESPFNNFGKRTIDDVCKQAAELGFDGIEFRGAPPVNYSSLSFKEYAAKISEAKKKYGLSEILFCFPVYKCTSADKEEREKDIAQTLEKARIANELCGTTICNTFGALIKSAVPTAPESSYEFHGSAVATQNDWDLTVDAFQKIGRALEKFGVKFGFETHMNYIHDLPEPSKKLVDLIDSPAIGINMDFGNTVYFPVRPTFEEAIELYGKKLFYIHLKNSAAIPGSAFRMATGLGEGDINHRAYYEKLLEIGFDGPIGIEAPRGGDKIHFAEQDLNYFKSVMAAF